MRRRDRVIFVSGAGVGLLGLALVVRFAPTLAFSLALAMPATETWMHRLGAIPVREAVTIPAAGGSLGADLYRPPAAHGALLLVHGLSRFGRGHPELVRLARLLAERGQLVLVPEFPGLSAFRLSGREIEEVRSALRYLAASGGTSSTGVGIAGFSFGAGPALRAAADVPDLRLAGSFGGYADLRHVILYITTGVHEFGGRRYVRSPEEYNRWKLLSLLVGFVEAAQDRERLEAIAGRKLANPADPTADLEAALGDEGRGMLALVLNRQEDAVAPLLARLPARARQALDDLSPLAVVPRLAGRLLIAHGAGDDSIPFTESLRLADAARGRPRAAILETFHHTGPYFWQSLVPRVRDAWRLLRLADDLLTE